MDTVMVDEADAANTLPLAVRFSSEDSPRCRPTADAENRTRKYSRPVCFPFARNNASLARIGYVWSGHKQAHTRQHVECSLASGEWLWLTTQSLK